MALTQAQIPVYATLPVSGVGILTGTSIGTLGSDTNGVTIHTAGTKGGRVTSLLGSTNDTVTVNVFLYILKVGGAVLPLGLVNIPLSSGNTAAAATMIDMLATIPGLPIDSQGKRYIQLGISELLKCTSLANLTSAKSAWLAAQAINIDPT